MNLTITLCVEDLDRTENFYRDVLLLHPERCQLLPGYPDILLLRHGESTFLFRERPARSVAVVGGSHQ